MITLTASRGTFMVTGYSATLIIPWGGDAVFVWQPQARSIGWRFY